MTWSRAVYEMSDEFGFRRGEILRYQKEGREGFCDLLLWDGLGESKNSRDWQNLARTSAMLDWDWEGENRQVRLRSAALLPHPAILNQNHLSRLYDLGFRSYKMKLNPSSMSTFPAFKSKWMEHVSNKSEPVRLRIDFNNSLSESAFWNFLDQSGPEFLKTLEYIEDPALLSPSWREWKKFVPLALDLRISLTATPPDLVDGLVVKTLRFDSEELALWAKRHRKFVTVTHNLDSMIGFRQAFREYLNLKLHSDLDLRDPGFDLSYLQSQYDWNNTESAWLDTPSRQAVQDSVWYRNLNWVEIP